VAALVLATTAGLGRVAVAPLETDRAFAATGPLPVCAYLDVLTSPRGYDDWATTLVDTILRVPRSYVPPDLTPVSSAGLGGSWQVRALMIPDLAALAAAAKAAGSPLGVASAYRSYTTQQTVFQGWVNKSGMKQALLHSARPGHSEHQLGLAIDFKSAGGGAPWDGPDWGQSPAGSWLRVHGWEYGFIQSYPKGKLSTTCYAYESWHFRYVGRDEAAAIHASGLTLREYLWANFTTAAVPGSSGPPPSTQPSAQPSDASFEPSASDELSPAPSTTGLESAAPSGTPSLGPSDGTGGTGGPTSSAGPLETAGTWFGLDPSVLAAIALVAVIAALVVTLGVGRFGSRRRGPGMAQKSRDGP
jgi:D-alanyl-D-alanine carboxypeptidase